MKDPKLESPVLESPARERAPRPKETAAPMAGGPAADLVSRVSCRLGDASCAGAHASTLQRARALSPESPGGVLRLQREYGNRFVRRVLDLARKGEGEAEITPETEQAIDRSRGGGRPLDGGVRRQMEGAFGADFGGVRVHTGAEPDALNRQLSARAFTTGQDVFFRHGQYDPGTSSGRELLAHELTHVVQQTGSVQAKLTLGPPGDRFEHEADQVAREVVQAETVQRQEMDEEEAES